jgi:hypothetical protein
VREKLGVQNADFLEGLKMNLSQYKFIDLYSLIQRALEYFRGSGAQGDFGQSLTPEEKAFYKTLLGISWMWVRLLVLRANGYKFDAYLREMSQFLDESEYVAH